ncbi:DEDD exonuclease domain-containing protein [Demequina aurantiaca]|uniref:DEDD exonuclease domain-containing protein n=1 Tax=Demequina aurantiaca TaxID=676200 RepID=UPI000A0052CC|nr:DEDD exonuclease domain-containing protein [Demequina aurantiaca]
MSTTPATRTGAHTEARGDKAGVAEPVRDQLGDIIQPGFDDIGEPLSATTFVVVDLETTGGSPATSAITEIGAVKTRGGEIIGEFQTFVDPGGPIPPFIIALTGITDAMVMAAPRIEGVLPAFLEFLGDSVLVAHNARFDVGFLKAACRDHGYAWPGNEIVDTLTLARRATTKEEAPNKKLATLARLFGSTVEPNHRALEDARATSQVLHGLFERLAAWGITHREDLDALRNPVPEHLRRKATMADAVPAKPGVYVFRGPRGEHLYVGTSKNLRSRVKTYFTRGEQRRRMREMLELAVSVEPHVCATPLEAAVLEVRMIDQYRPRYNRRSVRPERTVWLTLTDERYPRLSITRSADGKGTVLGPMRGGGDAKRALEALQHALRLRTCTPRLTVVPRKGARACLLKDLGACDAPCVEGADSGYDSVVVAARHAISQDPSPVIAALAAQVAHHAEALDYERAAELRDAASAIVEAGMRTERLASLKRVRLVATRRVGDSWELVSVAHGRLTGSARVTSGVWDAADALQSTWDADADGTPLIEEQEMVARWLEQSGTRLLHIDGDWAQPLASAGPHHAWVAARRSDHELVLDVARGDSRMF